MNTSEDSIIPYVYFTGNSYIRPIIPAILIVIFGLRISGVPFTVQFIAILMALLYILYDQYKNFHESDKVTFMLIFRILIPRALSSIISLLLVSLTIDVASNAI